MKHFAASCSSRSRCCASASTRSRSAACASRGCARWRALISIGRSYDEPRGARLRQALERLGPIFIKFGQVLSTRRDLLPADIADELALLQDRVPPFDGLAARALVEAGLLKELGRRFEDVFESFDNTPVASASIAQVHFATLEGRARGGGQGAAAQRAAGHRERPGDPAHRGALGRAHQRRRQAAAPARRRRRVRHLPARRARPDPRGRQRRAAAPQHGQPRPDHGARDAVGFLHLARDGDGAHVRRADQPGRPPAPGRRRHPQAGARRRHDLLHAGVPRRLLPRRHAPGQHPGEHRAGDLRPLHRARFRHHRHAHRVRQGLPGAELHRLLPARLQARGRAAHRERLGAARHPRWRRWRARCAPSASRTSTAR